MDHRLVKIKRLVAAERYNAGFSLKVAELGHAYAVMLKHLICRHMHAGFRIAAYCRKGPPQSAGPIIVEHPFAEPLSEMPSRTFHFLQDQGAEGDA